MSAMKFEHTLPDGSKEDLPMNVYHSPSRAKMLNWVSTVYAKTDGTPVVGNVAVPAGTLPLYNDCVFRGTVVELIRKVVGDAVDAVEYVPKKDDSTITF